MNEALDARNFIVDFIRREIVGPSPGYPAVQLNGEEILRPQDPPRQRYGAGILFPQRAHLEQQDKTGEEEQEAGDAASPEPDGIVASADEDGRGDTESERVDLPPETEQEVNLANQFLPSAMGLTALVDVPEIVAVRISAGHYDHEIVEWEKRKDKKGLEYFPKGWWRRPIDNTVTFPYRELIGSQIRYCKRTVVEQDGKPALILHVVSRPYLGSGGSDRRRLITFTLLNYRVTAGACPANEECFFQCGFSVTDPGGSRCFLSYPERRLNAVRARPRPGRSPARPRHLR